jgi:WD40 repeat protein
MRDGARALYLEGGATAFEIWDVTTGKPLASIPVESNSQLAALSADEAFIALAFSNTDGTKSYVSVREMATNRERASFALKEIVTPTQIAFSLDRRSLAVQDNDGRFAVYDISQWTTN